MGKWLEQNDFSGITFFGQDWGGLVGLRMVVNHDERFDSVVISNTGLPYNPDVSHDIIQAVEAFRANAPTPSLAQMQKAVSQMQGKAWEFFHKFEKPFLCAFADNDPVTAGLDAQFKKEVPGNKGLAQTTIKGGGHFVQENCPEQVSQLRTRVATRDRLPPQTQSGV